MAKPIIDWTIECACTPDFIEKCCKLFNQCGVYSFWFSPDTCAYVGMSKDLGSRMQSSFKDRALKHDGKVFFSVIQTDTRQEAENLESAMIKAMSPTLNRDYRKAKYSSFDCSGFVWEPLSVCKEDGVLAYRYGQYIIYPHGSLHAHEELRLREAKQYRWLRHEEMLMNAFSGASE